jgi:hypothetical protein
MCPACLANAAMGVAGLSASTGGLGALAVRILRWRKRTTRK